jgi:hypothetical protein
MNRFRAFLAKHDTLAAIVALSIIAVSGLYARDAVTQAVPGGGGAGYVQLRAQYCLDNARFDGGTARLYCLRPNAAGDLEIECYPSAGASCHMNVAEMAANIGTTLGGSVSSQGSVFLCDGGACLVGDAGATPTY